LYSDLLAGESLSADGRRQTQVIAQQSKRAADLIQQILDFSRRAVLERAPMEMSHLIKELMKLWQRTLPNNINLSFDYGRDTYGLYADPTRMQQMLMNLIINARDAMPNGGDLIVGLARRRIEKCSGIDSSAAHVGEWVQLTISDTGVGIGPEAIPHLYEPFFTTKGPGEGTGLGLAQVYGIVKQHNGHIEVESAVGQGTTFTIWLPALSGSVDGESMTETEIIMGNREMILVVEDNETTRRALLDSLDVLNYEAIVAANGREALAILDERSADIALILCDQTMPEMSGEALLTALKEQGSVIPFVLVSSYVAEADMTRLRRMGMVNWLAKPLKLQELSDTLAHALAVS
jgi:CheY-like chemotaxis protein